ncbi:MAG: dihydroflavonol-4-reductase [Flavobacteriaceae bacterium]|jgi:dihydroflavonol-4-reductase|tara:strand:- start:1065 stop:2066 length:1002 start_codon:yes stop_codon:yes gene_type:complete
MILVTGGTGLVGAHLLLKCVKKNTVVVATYRRKESLKNIKKLFEDLAPNNPGYYNAIRWKKAPLNDITALDDAFENIDYVYHCAAKVTLADSKTETLIKSNIEGTANLVNAAIKHKIKKLVFVSSIASIGAEKNIPIIDEESSWDSTQNHTAYGYSKYGAELEIWRGSQEGLKVVVVNPGVILGGQLWKRSTATLFRDVANGLRFYSTGSAAVVAVEDVVNVLVKLMESDIINERFILAAKNMSQKELITKIAASLGKNPPNIKLRKSLLYTLFFLEKILDVVGVRKKKISIAFIETLTSNQKYDGSKICSVINFHYSDIDETIEKIGASYIN